VQLLGRYATSYRETNFIVVLDSTISKKEDWFQIKNWVRRVIEVSINATYAYRSSSFSILFLANKQDLPNAKNCRTLARWLGLESWDRLIWGVFGCCAITGEGLDDALRWFIKVAASTSANNECLLSCRPSGQAYGDLPRDTAKSNSSQRQQKGVLQDISLINSSNSENIQSDVIDGIKEENHCLYSLSAGDMIRFDDPTKCSGDVGRVEVRH